MTIRIWGRATSVNVQKVTWALAEMEIPFERIDAGGHYGGTDTPEFLAMNPNRRVPVLEHDGLVMFESNAIVRHLARTHGAGSLLPDDEAGLAIADQWMDWAATTLSPAYMGIFWEAVRKPPSQRNADKLAALARDAADVLRIADARLQDSPNLCGERLSMGDIPVAALLYRFFDMAIDRPSLPALERWYGELGQRPAYRATVMTDYSSLAGKD
jgi:glutathione S-transferase